MFIYFSLIAFHSSMLSYTSILLYLYKGGVIDVGSTDCGKILSIEKKAGLSISLGKHFLTYCHH
jgi:hypothetical protein